MSIRAEDLIRPKIKKKPKETVKYDVDLGLSKQKIADIIIPHHNRHDMLKLLLDCIDNSLFNIIIVSGGSFGDNCNLGAKIAKTDKLIFMNDDMTISMEQLIRVVNCLDKYDFVGSTQLVGITEKRKYWGIGVAYDPANKKYVAEIKTTPPGSIFPSGAFFGIKKDNWVKLGGFDDRFKTGYEDVDFGIRALKLGLKPAILDLELNHTESQSSGRFKHEEDNQKILYGIYPNEVLLDLSKKYESINCVL